MSTPETPRASLYRSRLGRRRLTGRLFATVCLLATLTGVVVLAVLLGSVIVTALAMPPNPPWYNLFAHVQELGSFLYRLVQQTFSMTPEKSGYRAGIAGSLWLMGLVSLISLPIGVGAGIFLEEYAPPGRLRDAIQTNISNLAGVPSIVYGILGLVVFGRAFGIKSLAFGQALWAGAFTLSLLVLPIVVIATREAIRAVPDSLRQAGLALGATRWQMIRDHVLPSALPGIVTGAILALSRAIGETAPILMVGAADAVPFVPRGPSDAYTALTVEIYSYAKLSFQSSFQPVAAGGILLLLLILLPMNLAAILSRTEQGKKWAPLVIGIVIGLWITTLLMT